MNVLTRSSANPMPQGSLSHVPGWWPLLLGLIAYSTPWLINSGVSLSLNAFDLAEWASLHPAVRNSNPPLLTSLLLRLPLLCLALIAAFHESDVKTRWLRLLFVVGIGVSLLPPLEFFTQARADPNYQQQFILSLATLIGGFGGGSAKVNALRRPIILTITLVGAVTCLIGLAQGYNLMQAFGLATQVGLGGIVLTLVFAVIFFICLQSTRAQANKNKQGSTSVRATLFLT